MARRRACRSPRLARVTSFSTKGRSSFALGRVVVICSCLIRLAAMFANMAVRWAEVRLSLRCATPWRIGVSPKALSLDLVFELLGQVFDVFGRPVRHVHAQMQVHAGEHFLDLVQGLAAEIWSAEHLGFGLLDQVADIDDVVVLQAVGRPDSSSSSTFLSRAGLNGSSGLASPSTFFFGSSKVMKICSWSCRMRAA